MNIKNPQVGQISPSQLLYTYGIGAIVDLPQFSVIVTGLEDWPADPSIAEITEDAAAAPPCALGWPG